MTNPCYRCKYYWEDRSVGACDCDNADNMTEEEFEEYFVEEIGCCPYFVARWTDADIEAEDAYYRKIMEDMCGPEAEDAIIFLDK